MVFPLKIDIKMIKVSSHFQHMLTGTLYVLWLAEISAKLERA